MDGLEQVMEIPVAVVAVAIVAAIALFVHQRNRIINLREKRALQDDSLNEAQETIERGQQKVSSIEDELAQAKEKVTRLEAEKVSKDDLLSSVRTDVERERQAKERAQNQVTEVSKQNSSLETELKNTRDKLSEQGEFLENAKQQLSDAFRSLSGEALTENRSALLGDLKRAHDTSQETVGGLVEPVKKSLKEINDTHTA